MQNPFVLILIVSRNHDYGKEDVAKYSFNEDENMDESGSEGLSNNPGNSDSTSGLPDKNHSGTEGRKGNIQLE